MFLPYSAAFTTTRILQSGVILGNSLENELFGYYLNSYNGSIALSVGTYQDKWGTVDELVPSNVLEAGGNYLLMAWHNTECAGAGDTVSSRIVWGTSSNDVSYTQQFIDGVSDVDADDEYQSISYLTRITVPDPVESIDLQASGSFSIGTPNIGDWQVFLINLDILTSGVDYYHYEDGPDVFPFAGIPGDSSPIHNMSVPYSGDWAIFGHINHGPDTGAITVGDIEGNLEYDGNDVSICRRYINDIADYYATLNAVAGNFAYGESIALNMILHSDSIYVRSKCMFGLRVDPSNGSFLSVANSGTSAPAGPDEVWASQTADQPGNMAFIGYAEADVEQYPQISIYDDTDNAYMINSNILNQNNMGSSSVSNSKESSLIFGSGDFDGTAHTIELRRNTSSGPT